MEVGLERSGKTAAEGVPLPLQPEFLISMIHPLYHSPVQPLYRNLLTRAERMAETGLQPVRHTLSLLSTNLLMCDSIHCAAR